MVKQRSLEIMDRFVDFILGLIILMIAFGLPLVAVISAIVIAYFVFWQGAGGWLFCIPVAIVAFWLFIWVQFVKSEEATRLYDLPPY